MVKIIKIDYKIPDRKIARRAVKHLRAGQILIYPTDTSYGIGVLLDDSRALAELKSLKGRSDQKPFSVIVPHFEWILTNLIVDKPEEEILRKYLPGQPAPY